MKKLSEASILQHLCPSVCVSEVCPRLWTTPRHYRISPHLGPCSQSGPPQGTTVYLHTWALAHSQGHPKALPYISTPGPLPVVRTTPRHYRISPLLGPCPLSGPPQGTTLYLHSWALAHSQDHPKALPYISTPGPLPTVRTTPRHYLISSLLGPCP